MYKSVETLDVLLRAAYPLIQVVSHEEERVEQALASIVERKNNLNGTSTELWKWSVTKSAWSDVPGGGLNRKEDLEGPLDILDFILEYNNTAVFVLRDFGHYLKDSTPGSFLIQRKLKDLTTELSAGSAVVIVGHDLQLPGGLDKLMAVVDFDLPNRKEVEQNGRYLLYDCEDTKDIPDAGKDKILAMGAEAALGLTLAETENVFAKSLAMCRTLDPRVIMEEKKHIIRKSGVLQYYDVNTDLGDVGGLGNLKEWLSHRGAAFSDEARDYGLPHPKGVLIVGIPGTGKSLISKCIGRAWNMPVLRMDVGSLFGSLVGQSEANMRKALKTAEALSPCVLWIDELEKSLGGRGDLDGGTSARVFGSFLSWMQEKTSPVFVVATANDVAALPPEMLRKGRFDELFFVDLPTEEDREAILNIHLTKAKRDAKGYDVARLAEESDGFSGAELEQVIIDSLFLAFPENREPTTEDLSTAIERTVPLSKTMSDRLKALRKWADGRAVFAGDPPPEEAPKKKKAPAKKAKIRKRKVTMDNW